MKLTSKNILALFLGDIGSRLFGFLATAYLARTLGVSNFGVISIGLAILGYSMLINRSGLPILGTREIVLAKSDTGEFIGDMFSLRLILSVVAWILVGMVAFIFIKSPEILRVVLVYQLYLLPFALLPDWVFQGRNQMVPIAMSRVLGMGAYFLFVFAFVNSSSDITIAAVGWCFGGVFATIFLLYKFKKEGGRLAFHWSPRRWLTLWTKSLPLGAAAVIAQLTLQFPPIFLGIMTTIADVGIYTAAYKLVVLWLIIDRIFYFVFFPAVTRCFKESPERLETMLNRVLKYITVTAVSMGFFGILLAEPFIRFIFGPDYVKAILPFQLLIGYFILTMVNSVFAFSLIGIEQERSYTYARLFGSVVFFISALPLTTLFRVAGIAGALVLYEGATLIPMAAKLHSQIPLKLWQQFFRPIIAAAVLSIPFIIWNQLSFLSKVFAAVFIYLPILAVLSGFTKEDYRYLREKFL